MHERAMCVVGKEIPCIVKCTRVFRVCASFRVSHAPDHKRAIWDNLNWAKLLQQLILASCIYIAAALCMCTV